MPPMLMLLLYALLALAVSFICSLLEAALLSVPRHYVEALAAQGSRAGISLKGLKDNIDRPLAAILTLNTIAHTVGAAGVGAQAAIVYGEAVVGIASAVMTLAILVLSEIIPKTLGALHAKRLAAVTAYTTRALMVICYPILIMLDGVNRLVGQKPQRALISRLEVLSTIRMGGQSGSLAAREYQIVSNLLALSKVRVADILTPRTVMFALPADTTVQQAMSEHHPLRFSRIPVFGASRDVIAGYVSRFDVHQAAAAGRLDETLGKLQRPIIALPELASVAAALEQMLAKSQHIALAVDEYGGVAGIVALEDVLETLLGQEITDEADSVVDMQALARARAARRLPEGK